MSAGRIETYTHTDSITANKGGAIVKIGCDTDFAAKTDAFIGFSKQVAKFAYAASAAAANDDDQADAADKAGVTWEKITVLFPDLETSKASLEKDLREKIVISDIHIVRL